MTIQQLHYSFAVKSFVEMVKKFNTAEYEFAIRAHSGVEENSEYRYFRRSNPTRMHRENTVAALAEAAHRHGLLLIVDTAIEQNL